MGQFHSNLLQNEPKNAILHLKTKIIKKTKIYPKIFFFILKKKLWMKIIFLSKKASEYKFPIIFRYFFFTFPTFLYHTIFF